MKKNKKLLSLALGLTMVFYSCFSALFTAAMTIEELFDEDNPTDPTVHLISSSVIEVTLDKSEYEYTGSQITPEVVSVHYESGDFDMDLVYEEDYTCEFGENVDIGTGTVKIVGSNNSEKDNVFWGSVTVEFDIVEAAESSEVIDESSQIEDESSEIDDESSEVIDESSDIDDESSEVVDESSEVIDESSEVVDESSEVIDESSEVVDESSEDDSSSTDEPEGVIIWQGDITLTDWSQDGNLGIANIPNAKEGGKVTIYATPTGDAKVQISGKDANDNWFDMRNTDGHSFYITDNKVEINLNAEQADILANSRELVLKGINYNATMITYLAPEEPDSSSEVIDESSEVIDESSEVIDESSEVVDESSEVIDESSEADTDPYAIWTGNENIENWHSVNLGITNIPDAEKGGVVTIYATAIEGNSDAQVQIGTTQGENDDWETVKDKLGNDVYDLSGEKVVIVLNEDQAELLKSANSIHLNGKNINATKLTYNPPGTIDATGVIWEGDEDITSWTKDVSLGVANIPFAEEGGKIIVEATSIGNTPQIQISGNDINWDWFDVKDASTGEAFVLDGDSVIIELDANTAELIANAKKLFVKGIDVNVTKVTYVAPENVPDPDSSEVIDESSEVVDESSEVIDESSEVIDESSDIDDESSEVVDESSEVIDESSEVVDESSESDSSSTVDEPEGEVIWEGNLSLSDWSQDGNLGIANIPNAKEGGKVTIYATPTGDAKVQISGKDANDNWFDMRNTDGHSFYITDGKSQIVLNAEQANILANARQLVLKGVNYTATMITYLAPDEPDSSSEVIDESSEVVDESSEVIDESSEVVDESSEVIDESSEVIDESSETDDSSEVEPIEDPEYVSTNLTLSGIIGANTYYAIPDEYTTSNYKVEAVFTASGVSEIRVPLDKNKTKVINGVKTYLFTLPIKSCDMAKRFKGRLYVTTKAGEEVFATNATTITLNQYGLSLANTGSADEKTFAKALLTYGYYSQQVFVGTTPSGITPIDVSDVTYSKLRKYASSTEDADGVLVKGTIYGTSLYLDSGTGIRSYVKDLDGVDTDNLYMEYFANGNTNRVKAQYSPEKDAYYGEIPDIAADKLSTMYKICFVEGDTQITDTAVYGAYSYIYSTLRSTTATDADQNLARALYKYSLASESLIPDEPDPDGL